MATIHTLSGAVKLPTDVSAHFRSAHALARNIDAQIYQPLVMALEKQSMRSEVTNIVLVETMTMDVAEAITLSYSMGFNLSLELAADVRGLELENGEVILITGKLERVDAELVRMRRSIIITPTQINAMSVDGNMLDESLAFILQKQMMEFKELYPHRPVSDAVKAL
ncbi:hypothetical protein BIZ82_gp003 [Erwinia phage vB_EamM_EarlPhillipIV]|uniref:Uncharacterized protein n=1 Tax=Erwinia phage vB_EamM_EarlPhillipIV TaxID=1883372 RepID=A0A1B2IC41_9CAUD|nr:hypothetical protein BIZ82_gp003 [Erwinia phage vB_EamM_EarlPhillipIV]ANZ48853.1 hypothetical protein EARLPHILLIPIV_3 [Erwinia phage vB_EamM_EarlPhillipIV]